MACLRDIQFKVFVCVCVFGCAWGVLFTPDTIRHGEGWGLSPQRDS